MEPSHARGTTFRNAFVLLLVAGISLLALAVAWPFVKALLLGAMLAGLSHPLYRWLTRRFKGRESLASFTTLLILIVLAVGPLGAFIGVVISQAFEVSEHAIPWVRTHFGASSGFNLHDWLSVRIPPLAPYLPSQDALVENVGSVAKATGAYMVTAASRMSAVTAAFLLDAFVMFYAMFFFLRDGDARDDQRYADHRHHPGDAGRTRAVGGRDRWRGFFGHDHGHSVDHSGDR